MCCIHVSLSWCWQSTYLCVAYMYLCLGVGWTKVLKCILKFWNVFWICGIITCIRGGENRYFFFFLNMYLKCILKCICILKYYLCILLKCMRRIELKTSVLLSFGCCLLAPCRVNLVDHTTQTPPLTDVRKVANNKIYRRAFRTVHVEKLFKFSWQKTFTGDRSS